MTTLPTDGARTATGLIQDWRPEDTTFWASEGQRIASRNLSISVPALLLAFAVWMMFSADWSII